MDEGDNLEDMMNDLEDVTFTLAMKLAAKIARRFADMDFTQKASGPAALRAFATVIEEGDKTAFGRWL